MRHAHSVSVLLIATLLLTSLFIAQDVKAEVIEICDKWGTANVMGGEYIVQNNIWGASTAQCVTLDTNSTSFTVSRSDHNQNSVASYPSIFKGCHWSLCTPNSGMPIAVNQVSSAPFSWSISASASGAWNVAAEAWFSTDRDTSDGYGGGAELMIWLDYQNMQPAGSQIGTVSIAGATWEVWYANIGWNYIAYRRTSPATSISADLVPFINDAVSRGYIQTSWYLSDLEAGFELMSGGTGLRTNSFSFSVNSGQQPTPTPQPTVGPSPTQPPSSGACSATYRVTNQWNTGFTADVIITNRSSSAIQGWTLTWTHASGQQVTDAWNASVTQSGSAVTASNPAGHWNGVIGANGGTVTFGFQGTHSGTVQVPTDFVLNGTTCSNG